MPYSRCACTPEDGAHFLVSQEYFTSCLKIFKCNASKSSFVCIQHEPAYADKEIIIERDVGRSSYIRGRAYPLSNTKPKNNCNSAVSQLRDPSEKLSSQALRIKVVWTRKNDEFIFDPRMALIKIVNGIPRVPTRRLNIILILHTTPLESSFAVMKRRDSIHCYTAFRHRFSLQK